MGKSRLNRDRTRIEPEFIDAGELTGSWSDRSNRRQDTALKTMVKVKLA
ncbi:hypothetical protein LINPERHAP1_LOCUS37846 [Linum perenne]